MIIFLLVLAAAVSGSFTQATASTFPDLTGYWEGTLTCDIIYASEVRSKKLTMPALAHFSLETDPRLANYRTTHYMVQYEFGGDPGNYFEMNHSAQLTNPDYYSEQTSSGAATGKISLFSCEAHSDYNLSLGYFSFGYGDVTVLTNGKSSMSLDYYYNRQGLFGECKLTLNRTSTDDPQVTRERLNTDTYICPEIFAEDQ
jgi:hypothetical protein